MGRQLTLKEHIEKAAQAHTNLTMMHAVMALLESGCIYGHLPAADKMIGIARVEAGRQLRTYDRHAAAAARQASAAQENPHED